MIIYRYVARQILSLVAIISSVLLLVMLGSRLTNMMARALAGDRSPAGVLSLLMFTIPEFMVDILPIALLLSILLVVAKLYVDQEMTVCFSCGISPNKIFASVFAVSIFIALLMWFLLLVVAPLSRAKGNEVYLQSQQEFASSLLSPGRFLPLGEQRVLYVAQQDGQQQLQQVFVASSRSPFTPTSAQAGLIEVDDHGNGFLVLEQGTHWSGQPLASDFSVSRFDRYGFLLNREVNLSVNRLNEATLFDLVAAAPSNRRYASELLWRLTFPLVALVVPFIAFPLARSDSRSGKFAKILPAALIYVFYTLFLQSVQRMANRGEIPLWLGSWWLHLCFLALALLIWYAPGWRARLLARRRQRVVPA